LKPDRDNRSLVSDTRAVLVRAVPEEYMNKGPEEVSLAGIFAWPKLDRGVGQFSL